MLNNGSESFAVGVVLIMGGLEVKHICPRAV